MKKITFLIMTLFAFSFGHAQYLTEDFETAVPPTGWLDEAGSTNGANTDIWIQSMTQANSGTYSALFNDTGAGDRWLISPVMDLSGATAPELTYFDHVNFVSFADTHDVLYSTDYTGSGDPEVATWTSLNAVIGTEDTWVENGPYALPVNATVYIAFHYIGDNSADWYIDDILVREAPTCIPAVVDSATIVDDCTAGTFTVDILVSDAGDAGSVFDDGTTTYPVVAGTVTVGPYNIGDIVTIELVAIDTDCSFTVGTYSFTCPPSNNDPANAIALIIDEGAMCGANAITGITNEATSDSGVAAPSCGSYGTPTARGDLWYTFTAPASGQLTLNTTNLSVLTSVAGAYYSGTPGSLVEEGCTEFGSGWPWDLSGLTDGETYYLRVWDYGNDQTGTFDLCGYFLNCTPATVAYTVVSDCDNSGGFNIEVDITDLGSATALTISDDQGSADQAATTATILTFGPYVNGTDVIITVVDDGDASCTEMSSALTQDDCPPVNDDFANAIAVACDGNYTGSTTLATLDEDDAPDGSNADLDAPNVWYTYTGSGTAEDITIDLCPSSYDTSVLVYTGTSGNLTLVASNDDGGSCASGTRSYLTFQSDGSTTYYITIEGWNVGNTGDYDMTVTCEDQIPAPPNDLCANAEVLTVATPVLGTTVGATVEVADANPSCESSFATIVDVWYSFIATDEEMTITTTIGSADQANVAVYDDCTLASQVGCSDANGGETLDLTGLTVGNTYIVRVWNDGAAPVPTGTASREGDFTITVNATLSTGSFENDSAFTYYPNPVKNTLTLNAQNTIEHVTMYNMLGQEVLRATPNAVDSDLDMSSLDSGTYFVKVTIANVTKTVRVIKQ